jgi:hypothetical protein
MVKILVKSGDQAQFLFETTVDSPAEDTIEAMTEVYNGRLKVDRICSEIGELADHGITLPPNMQASRGRGRWVWEGRRIIVPIVRSHLMTGMKQVAAKSCSYRF